MNFSHLSNFDHTDEPVEMPLTMIRMNDKGVYPTLYVFSATSNNKAYTSAYLKKQPNFPQQVANQKFDDKMMMSIRETEKSLYANNVIVDWKDVYDSDGNAVKYSSAACGEFLDALPLWIFDQIRTFCTDNYNFIRHNFLAMNKKK